MPTPTCSSASGTDPTTLVLDDVASTQDEARRLVAEGNSDLVCVRALHQSAGRGRRGAIWEAAPGTCLLATYILRGVPAGTALQLGLTAGLAVADTVEALLGGLPQPAVRLKWPNDALLRGRKVAGILVETLSARSVALVGIGLNLNIPTFPRHLASVATSLLAETGRPLDPASVEAALRPRVLAAPLVPWPVAVARWRTRDATPGLRYRAIVDGAEVEAVAAGVADSGALVLRLADGRMAETWSASSVPVPAR